MILTNFITIPLFFIFIFCTLAVVKDLYGVAKSLYLHKNYEFTDKKTFLFGLCLSYIITYLWFI